MPRRGEARWGRAESIRQNSAAGKVFIHPHEHPERLTFPLRKHEPPIHDSRYEVVYHRFRRGVLPICQPSCPTHVATLSRLSHIPGKFLIIYLSLNNVDSKRITLQRKHRLPTQAAKREQTASATRNPRPKTGLTSHSNPCNHINLIKRTGVPLMSWAIQSLARATSAFT